MYEARHAKQMETDRTLVASAQKPTKAKDPLQHAIDPSRLPLYTQAWGNRPPPWLRLSSSPQVASEQPVQRHVEEEQFLQGVQHESVSIQEMSPLQRREAPRAQFLGNHVLPWLRLSPSLQGQQEKEPALGHVEPLQHKGNTAGLPDYLKAGIEEFSGFSLDDVQVHYHSSKPAQVQALAYTQGTEIHVGPGQEKHLEHEAWHVVQQKQGRVRPTIQIKGNAINNDHALEREADEMKEKIVLSPMMQGASNHHLIRDPLNANGEILQLKLADFKEQLSDVQLFRNLLVQLLVQNNEQEISALSRELKQPKTDSPFVSPKLRAQFSLILSLVQSLLIDLEVPFQDAAAWLNSTSLTEVLHLQTIDQLQTNYNRYISTRDYVTDLSRTRPPYPNTLHFIWSGEAITSNALSNIKTWGELARASNWTVIIWTDKVDSYWGYVVQAQLMFAKIQLSSIGESTLDPRLWPYYQVLIEGKNYPAASDLARYSILQKYGGIYIDVDIAPGKVTLGSGQRKRSNILPLIAPELRDAQAVRDELGITDPRVKPTFDQVQKAARQRISKGIYGNQFIISPPNNAAMEKIIQIVEGNLKQVGVDVLLVLPGETAAVTGPNVVKRGLVAYLEEKYPDLKKDPDKLIDVLIAALGHELPIAWITAESEQQVQ